MCQSVIISNGAVLFTGDVVNVALTALDSKHIADCMSAADSIW